MCSSVAGGQSAISTGRTDTLSKVTRNMCKKLPVGLLIVFPCFYTASFMQIQRYIDCIYLFPTNLRDEFCLYSNWKRLVDQREYRRVHRLPEGKHQVQKKSIVFSTFHAVPNFIFSLIDRENVGCCSDNICHLLVAISRLFHRFLASSRNQRLGSHSRNFPRYLLVGNVER